MKVLLLCLTLISFISITSAACDFGSANQANPNIYFASLQEAKACFESIAMDNTIATDTINVLKGAIKFYSFYDMVQRGNIAPYDISVDLEGTLDTMLGNLGGYANDWAFQNDLHSLFVKLRDAHTIYLPPTPYQFPELVRPFSLSMKSNADGSLDFYLKALSTYAADILDQTQITLLNSYMGSKLNSINSVEMKEWFVGQNGYTDLFYESKDLGVRLNTAVKSHFATTSFSGVYKFVTGNEQYSITLNDSSTVTYDWAPLVAFPLVNGETAFKANYLRSSKRSVEEDKRVPYWHLLPREQHYISEESVFENHDKIRVREAGKLTLVKEFGVFSYLTYNDTVAVLRIGSFSFDSSLYNQYAELIKFMIEDAQSKSITQLIIEVLDNGGGIICMSRAVCVNFIAKMDMSTENVYMPYDYYGYNGYPANIGIDPNGEIPEADRAYCDYNSGEPFTQYSSIYTFSEQQRGSSKAKYSNKFSIYCGAVGDGDDTLLKNLNSAGYYFEKIIILTDGFCGSACCQMSASFYENKAAKIVSYGGIKGTTIETGSFCGGNVETWSKFTIGKDGLKNFTTSADFTFNYSEMFMRSKLDMPREFVRIEPDYRLDTLYPAVVPADVLGHYTTLIADTSALFSQFEANNVGSSSTLVSWLSMILN